MKLKVDAGDALLLLVLPNLNTETADVLGARDSCPTVPVFPPIPLMPLLTIEEFDWLSAELASVCARKVNPPEVVVGNLKPTGDWKFEVVVARGIEEVKDAAEVVSAKAEGDVICGAGKANVG